MPPTFSARRILVPTDFGHVSEEALRVALDFARSLDATVVLQHVFELPPSMYLAATEGLGALDVYTDEEPRRQLRELAERARLEWPKIEWRIDRGVDWEQILAAAKEERAAFIVMGTRGRTGCMRLLLGSVAEQVVRRASMPVLTVGEGATTATTASSAPAATALTPVTSG